MINYSRETLSGKEKSASWRYMMKLPVKKGVLRFSIFVRAASSNPNAKAELSVNWNAANGRWVRSTKNVIGKVSVPVTEKWQKVSFEVSVPDLANVSFVSFMVGGSHIRPGELFFDGLQIEKAL